MSDGVPDLSANDRALVAEAVRRVQANRSRPATDPTLVARAVSAAVLQGRRDLFGLVKLGCKASDQNGATTSPIST